LAQILNHDASDATLADDLIAKQYRDFLASKFTFCNGQNQEQALGSCNSHCEGKAGSSEANPSSAIKVQDGKKDDGTKQLHPYRDYIQRVSLYQQKLPDEQFRALIDMQMHKFKGMKSILVHPKARTLRAELRRKGVIAQSEQNTPRANDMLEMQKLKKEGQMAPSATAMLACMKEDDRIAIERLS